MWARRVLIIHEISAYNNNLRQIKVKAHILSFWNIYLNILYSYKQFLNESAQFTKGRDYGDESRRVLR